MTSAELIKYYDTCSFGYLFYGSVVESLIGLNTPVHDIDAMVFDEREFTHLTHMTEFMGGEFINYEPTLITVEDLVHEIYTEPKMLLCASSIEIECYFDKSKIRSSVSNVSSKAYNKGKKKLTVQDDYDPDLGLKNLWHSVKFPYFAKWKFIDKIHIPVMCSTVLCSTLFPQCDILYLNELRSKIFSTYLYSTGSLDDRFNAVNQWLKPEFNRIMTEFRKNFPKEI